MTVVEYYWRVRQVPAPKKKDNYLAEVVIEAFRSCTVMGHTPGECA
jgi:hypothetical protein